MNECQVKLINKIGINQVILYWLSHRSEVCCIVFSASNEDQHLMFLWRINKTTIKFLNFLTPENFAVIYLKFKGRGQSLRYFVKKVQMK